MPSTDSLTQKDLAEKTGLSPRAIRRKHEEGLPRNEDGSYPPEAVDFLKGLAAEATSEHLLPLDQIEVAEGENPRKHFDEDALEELAASIRENGLLQPILVRPVGEDEYELVAGERRLRAHQRLGRRRIRSTVREMSKETAVRIRLIENLHREDLHELEEAHALHRMKDELGLSVEEIADEIGKSVRYVYQRLSFLDLADPVREALDREDITASHATEIGRLPTEELQEAALEHAVSTRHVRRPDGGGDVVTTTTSVRDLRQWIRRECHLNLHAAPWKKDDAKLLPQAGPCTTCPKRTGNAQELFPEIEEDDTCLDRDCYKEKEQAYLDRRWAQLQKAADSADAEAVRLSAEHWSVGSWNAPDLPEDTLGKNAYTRISGTDEPHCDHEVAGLFVDGNEIGELVDVCLKRTGCEVHYAGTEAEDPEEKRRREISQRNAKERGRRRNERSREIARRALREQRRRAEEDEGLLQLARFAVVRLAEELHQNTLKRAIKHYVSTRDDLEPFWESDSWGSVYMAWLGELVQDVDRCSWQDLQELLLLLTVAPHLGGNQGQHPAGFSEEDLALAWDVDPEAIEEELREDSNWILPEDLLELDYLVEPEDEDSPTYMRRTYHASHAGEDVPMCGAEEDLEVGDVDPTRHSWRLCAGCEDALLDVQTSAMDEDQEGGGEPEGGEEAPDAPDPSEDGDSPDGSPSEAEDEATDDPFDGCMSLCRRRMDEDPDVTNQALYDACEAEYPDYVGDLSLRQFHARFPLKIKRERARQEQGAA